MLKKIKRKLNQDKHLHELFKGSSVSFLYRLLGTLFGYILTYFIATKFGAEVMGIFALSMAFLSITTIFSKFGLDTAIIRFVAENISKGKVYLIKDYYLKSLIFVFFSSIVISILAFYLSEIIAQYVFKKPHLYIYFQIISLGILPYTLFFLHAEAIRGLKKIAISSFLKNIPIPLFTLIFLIIFSYTSIITNYKVIPNIAYLISIVIVFLISMILWIKITNLFSIRIENKNKLSSFKKILKISFPMMLTSSLVFINNWTDLIMLGIFINEKDVGIYNVVNKIVNIMIIPMIAIVSIAAPKFSEFWGKEDLEGLKKFVQQISKITFLIGIFIFVFLTIFSYQILLFFGKEFVQGETALIILLISMLFYMFFGPTHILMNMTGKEVAVQNIMLLSAVINIILNFFFIPVWGINGAAIATLISKLFFYFTAAFLVKKYYGFLPYNLKNLFKL